MQKKAKMNDVSRLSAQTPDLTPREQEVYDFLLKNATPKEIAFSLNISHDTVLAHQRNLYRKLGVHSKDELKRKYLPSASAAPAKKFNMLLMSAGFAGVFIIILFLFMSNANTKNDSVVFLRWLNYQDNLGSILNVTTNIESIQGQFYPTITITGIKSEGSGAYTGVTGYPDPSTLKAIKNAASLSFNVLGDGNMYELMITTKESRLDGEYNHYQIAFDTKKDETSVITVNIHDLTQQTGWGKPVSFNLKNAELLQFGVSTPGLFNLKIWDIKFYR